MTVTTILHLTERSLWDAARAAGRYEMSTRDTSLADEGFIHCALPSQLAKIASFVRDDETDLLLLVIDAGKVGAPVRFEASRPGGTEYPHIYGPLPVDAVTEVREWPTEIEDLR